MNIVLLNIFIVVRVFYLLIRMVFYHVLLIKYCILFILQQVGGLKILGVKSDKIADFNNLKENSTIEISMILYFSEKVMWVGMWGIIINSLRLRSIMRELFSQR